MADNVLKQKIRDALKLGVFAGSDDAVDVSDGEVEPNIHVVIFSRKFDGLGFVAKHDFIWHALSAALSPDEIASVSLAVGVSPSEAKAHI